MNRHLITSGGYKKLIQKFENLNKKLKAAQKEVADAMGDGDFREDSKYATAINERSKVEKSIDDLKEIIDTSSITAPDMSSDVVSFGRSAEVQNLDTDEIKTITIVGIHESEPSQGEISYVSPFGKAMLGLAQGDGFEVITPTRESSWEVLKII